MISALSTIERRFAALELRAAGKRLSGYAAVFDQSAVIYDNQTESISQGAFTATLATNPDILALLDHEPSKVLGRTRAKTLVLEQDEHGLRFDLSIPDTQTGRDTLELARRGDLGGASFGFTVLSENRSGNHREILAVTLHEISIISAWPAYSGTSVEARQRLAMAAPARAALTRAIKIMEL